MKDSLRLLGVFAIACLAAVYVHEIGHALAAWLQGIPAVPTPAKEYLLRDEVAWSARIWISLGGVAATALVTLATVLWYLRSDESRASAVLAGVLLTPALYTLRFLVAGRGHDGLEWQQAQAALGLTAHGHAVDVLFALLVVLGVAAWAGREHGSLRPTSLLAALGLLVAGVVLLLVLQVANNALFDRFFPETTTVGAPAGFPGGSTPAP